MDEINAIKVSEKLIEKRALINYHYSLLIIYCLFIIYQVIHELPQNYAESIAVKTRQNPNITYTR